MTGLLLVDKPEGLTSHDVVDRIRHLTNERRVGHTGTLDPFATGLLIVLIGKEATTRQRTFLRLTKTYWARLALGATSTTDDPEGIITTTQDATNPSGTPPSRGIVEQVAASFVGTYRQIPPPFSAKKISGSRAYALARKGVMPDLPPVPVTISALIVHAYAWPVLEIETTVSSGTYIRALARDIGTALHSGAYLTRLRRTAIGPFSVAEAAPLISLTPNDVSRRLLSVSDTLRRLDNDGKS